MEPFPMPVTAEPETSLLTGSAEQFRLLVQSVTDYAIYMLDTDGKVCSWNIGAERIKGYAEPEILGRSFTLFYTPEDQAQGIPMRNLQHAADTGRTESEGWRVRKNGELFWAHVVIDRVVDADGRLLGFAKITRDVTEQRDTNARLAHAREELFQAQKMEAIGRLTGGMAHDFNNLLMAVLGNLEMLGGMLSTDARARTLLDNAIAGAQRGAALTQRMLAFARRQQLDPTAVEIPSLVQGMASLLRRSIGTEVSIETSFPLHLERALVDANQLELALMNLIVNARDAMPNGGRIGVRARMEQVADGSRANLSSGSYVCLSVSDSGIGMDEETLARATEPFFTTKGVGEGTGLGLSMVHGMAEQSKGCFVLKSRLGHGTTAELWFPVAPSRTEDAAAELQQARPRRDGRHLRILAVDDDGLVLTTMTMLLEVMGHDPIEASSAEQALEVLRDTEVDLVITDYAMPGMNGAQLVTAIRSRWPDLPVIVASGYTDADAIDVPVERLSKPYGRQELADAIRKAKHRSLGAHWQGKPPEPLYPRQ
jgi:PAS domain S-box-containing protein